MFGKRFIILEIFSKRLMKIKCNWNVKENKIKQYLLKHLFFGKNYSNKFFWMILQPDYNTG